MLPRWLSFWKVLPSPQSNSGALSEWPSGSWSPPWPRSFPLIAQFGRAASFRKSLGGSKILPFNNDGGHYVLGDLQCCRNVLLPFPKSVLRHNPVAALLRAIPSSSWLGFALTCTVNCGTLYRKGCAFPNHVQSIEFTTGGLQSSCRNISRLVNGNGMHLSSFSRLLAKVLNTYVNNVFLFKLFS